MVSRVAASSQRPDEVVTEEPLEVRVDDKPVATTMRTPGNDFELAVGLCHAEGLLRGPVLDIRYCATGSAAESEFNVVTVDAGGRSIDPPPRHGPIRSACGVCGTDVVAEVSERLAPLSPLEVTAEVLAAVEEEIEPAQQLFRRTGGLHAAADFDVTSGALGAVREDIGRHNAVDKVVGRMVLDGRSADGRGLWVSGRASYEMVQKAWAGGFGVVVSVSAVSSLAIDVAKRGQISLYGFSRGGDAVRYN